MRILLSMILVFGILIYAISSSAKLYAPIFLDIPSAIFVFGISTGFMLAVSKNGDWATLGRFLLGAKPASSGDADVITAEQADSMCSMLNAGARAAVASGFIGTVIGFVIILMNMSGLEGVCISIAVALITIVYGLILSELILVPASRIAAKRYLINNESCKELA